MDPCMRIGIRLWTVMPDLAATLDLDNGVRVHVSDPPLSVGVAGMNPRIRSLVHDPKPSLVHCACWGRFVHNDHLSANFDERQVCEDVDHTDADHDRCNS